MDEELYIKRSVYRELFNDLCADFSIYRLNNPVDEKFLEIESKLWNYREKSKWMEREDIEEYSEYLVTAQAYLVKKKIF